MKTVKAQLLYDLREKHEFCSGNDLHEFFRSATDDNDPSPIGKVKISAVSAACFFSESLRDITAQTGDSTIPDKILNSELPKFGYKIGDIIMTEELKQEVFEYLDELIKSGVTNMFGAASYVNEKFSLGMKESRKVVVEWMEQY